MRILVLDTTHGGDLLAEEYRSLGHEVTAVDIYQTANPALKLKLTSLGIGLVADSPAEAYDLVVAPIHCPDKFLGDAKCDSRITHHEAVGQLAKFKYKTVEVTGTRGKTSTCYAIAHILSHLGKRVLLLTSRGVFSSSGGEMMTIEDRASIAPPSVLKVSKMEQDFDVGVFEISLGGVGLGDVSVITTLGNNYEIAGGTRKAFDGKVQMMKNAKGIAVYPASESEIWAKHVPKGVRKITFGPQGDIWISMPDGLSLGGSVTATVHFKDGDQIPLRLSGEFLAPSYCLSMSAALAAVDGLGLNMKDAARSLNDFKGVPGRGEVRRENGSFLVRDRNPGVSAESVRWQLDVLNEYYGVRNPAVVIDPVNQKVCEKLDLRELEKVVEDHHIRNAFLIDKYQGKCKSDLFKPIHEASEVMHDNHVVLWCTKEGFQ